MRPCIFMLLISIAMSPGCSWVSEKIRETHIIDKDKIYEVVFEDRPEIVKKEIYARGVELGKIISETSTPENTAIVRIAVQSKHSHLMKSNTVFYLSYGRMDYDALEDGGNPLPEGSKILGFDGIASLYLFKTKNNAENLSDAAIRKAQELYEKSAGGHE